MGFVFKNGMIDKCMPFGAAMVIC